MLGIAGQNLERWKEKFKAELLHQAEQWRQRCLALYETFMASGPFHATVTTTEAMEAIAGVHAEMDKVVLFRLFFLSVDGKSISYEES